MTDRSAVWGGAIKKWLLVAVILGGLFYWFQLRPSNVRIKCGQEARVWIANSDPLSLFTSYDEVYRGCLHENGLE